MAKSYERDNYKQAVTFVKHSVITTETSRQDKRRWEVVNDILNVFRIKSKMIAMR